MLTLVGTKPVKVHAWISPSDIRGASICRKNLSRETSFQYGQRREDTASVTEAYKRIRPEIFRCTRHGQITTRVTDLPMCSRSSSAPRKLWRTRFELCPAWLKYELEWSW